MTKKEPTKKNTTKQPHKKTEVLDVISDNTKLKLKLVWKDIETEYNRLLKNSAKNVKAQGFRKGKAPLKVAEERIGKERLINQVLETLIPARYEKLIETEKKQPLTQPQISPLSMDWGQDWELEVQIAEQPILDLKNYKKAVKKGLQEALEHLKKEATTKKKEAAKTKQDKKETPKEPTPAETAAKEREHQLHHVFKELVAVIQPRIPELLLKEETKREIQRMASELEKMGLSLDDYLARRGQKFEEMSSQIAAQVLGQLQLEFVLRAIEETEKIEVSDQDQRAELAKIEDENLRKQILDNPQYLDHLSKQISRSKLIEQLLKLK